MNGIIIVRSSTAKDRPFYILDPVTLEEKREFFEIEKDNINPEWREDKENNRYMTHTPLFTDSNLLYILSYKKPEKGKSFILTTL